jgi:hypothetical protein
MGQTQAKERLGRAELREVVQEVKSNPKALQENSHNPKHPTRIKLISSLKT